MEGRLKVSGYCIYSWPEEIYTLDGRMRVGFLCSVHRNDRILKWDL